MATFRRLTVKRLPRVMVHVLALDPRDQQVLLEDLEELVKAVQPRSLWADAIDEVMKSADDGSLLLASMFVAVLDLPLCERVDFAARFDRLLDAQGDLFGTEGQNDPRGDRRD